MYWESALQQKRTHPESNRNPGRDPAHLPLMVCSTHCTAVTVLLSRTRDMRFCLGHRQPDRPPPDRAGLDLSLLTVFGLFVCLALTWRYRLSHNQPPSYDTRQPNNKRRTVNIQRSRLLSPTGFIVIITYYFVAFVAFLISLKSFLILYYSPSVLHQQFHGMSCLPDMPIQIFACLYCQKSQQ